MDSLLRSILCDEFTNLSRIASAMVPSPTNGIPDFPIIISDYLEKHATEEQRKQGLDIADFL